MTSNPKAILRRKQSFECPVEDASDASSPSSSPKGGYRGRGAGPARGRGAVPSGRGISHHHRKSQGIYNLKSLDESRRMAAESEEKLKKLKRATKQLKKQANVKKHQGHWMEEHYKLQVCIGAPVS
eukprot:gene7199-366_t